MRALLLLAVLTTTAHAQWDIQAPATTADLRGIDSVGPGIAWASGTNGTVLRTEDAGYLWQVCTIPPGAEHLDFRGIQAFDANTAIVMSSGKGDLSRLYKTTDGCQTWKKIFDNPDETGFFDSLRKVTATQLYLLGDPVNGKFSMFTSRDAGNIWYIADDPGLDVPASVAKDTGAFAASNSAFTSLGPFLFFGSGGPQASIYAFSSSCNAKTGTCTSGWISNPVPLAQAAASAGIFSLAGHAITSMSGKTSVFLMAVGGDYSKPADSTSTAAFSADNGHHWTTATIPPHGYRSSVVYDAPTNSWITVGPNGTDISTDDGRNWRALHPTPGESLDADQHWNALSLPFVVGPHGRIGILNPSALQAPTKAR